MSEKKVAELEHEKVGPFKPAVGPGDQHDDQKGSKETNSEEVAVE